MVLRMVLKEFCGIWKGMQQDLNALDSAGFRRCSQELKPKPKPKISKPEDRKLLSLDTPEPWTPTGPTVWNLLKILANPLKNCWTSPDNPWKQSSENPKQSPENHWKSSEHLWNPSENHWKSFEHHRKSDENPWNPLQIRQALYTVHHSHCAVVAGGIKQHDGSPVLIST